MFYALEVLWRASIIIDATIVRSLIGTPEIKMVVFHSFHDLLAAFARVGFPTEVTYGVASRKEN